MANIIDALVVTLGLDASGMKSGADEATKAQEKIEKDSTKTATTLKKDTKEVDDVRRKTEDLEKRRAKEAELRNKNSIVMINKMRNTVLGLFAAFTAGKGIKEFYSDITTSDAAMGRLAANTGSSTEEMSAWGAVAKSMGGQASDATDAIAQMNREYMNMKLFNIPSPKLLGFYSLLGIQLKDASGKMKSFTEIMLETADKTKNRPLPEAQAIYAQLGIPSSIGTKLHEGRDATQRLFDVQMKLAKLDEETAKRDEDLTTSRNNLNGISKTLGRTLGNQVTPYIIQAEDDLTKLGSQLKGHPFVLDFVVGAGTAVVLATAKALTAIGPVALISKAAPWVAAALAALHSKDLNVGEDEKMAQMKKDYLAGNKKAPRNLRNNNPGNIEYGKFAKAHGATGSDGRFAIFKTLEDGYAALRALLANYSANGRDTVSSIFDKYAPSGENNTAAYKAYIAKQLGVGVNQPLNLAENADMRAKLAQNIGQYEGMPKVFSGTATGAGAAMMGASNRSSTNTSTAKTDVHIGTIVVQTQAKNADGIARDLGPAVSQYFSLTNQSNSSLA